jgi:hypothetical protein
MFEDFDPRDRGRRLRDIEMPWIKLAGVVRALTEKRTTFAIAPTTLAIEIAKSASGTTTRAMRR